MGGAMGGGGGGMMGGLMGSLVTGAAMGTGSAMAHRAVDSFMGPRETSVVHQNAPEAAPQQQVLYTDMEGMIYLPILHCRMPL